MLGLSSIPSRDTCCSKSASKTACRTSRHFFAALDRVRSVHQHFGLDDRHHVLLLAERGIARERVRVDLHAGRHSAAHRSTSITARHLANRAPIARYSSRRPRSPSSPSVMRSSGKPASGFAPRSTLMPGMIPCVGEQIGQARTRRAPLADRLVLQDDAADVLGDARRGEEHLAVGAAAVRCRVDPKRAETLRQRPGSLVSRQDALSIGDKRSRGDFQVR